MSGSFCGLQDVKVIQTMILLHEVDKVLKESAKKGVKCVILAVYVQVVILKKPQTRSGRSEAEPPPRSRNAPFSASYERFNPAFQSCAHIFASGLVLLAPFDTQASSHYWRGFQLRTEQRCLRVP